MSADLKVFRALCYTERAIAMSYAVPYALHQAAQLYAVPAGALAELLLAKHVECARARAERDAMAAHDAQVEAGPRSLSIEDRARAMVEARACGETLEEIAARFGLTRQRVQQITGGRRAA
jgi:DNA-directed RNA polymerase sigma subunit (sigma70/sigma32)